MESVGTKRTIGWEHLPHENTGFPGGRWWRFKRETSSAGVEDGGVDGDDMRVDDVATQRSRYR